MRALILAAGSGRRLGHYALNRPKCLLEFAGRTLLEWQLSALASVEPSDIAVVTGHCADAFARFTFRQFHNKDYATTNMVASLFCAQDTFDQDLIVTYGDIVYEPRLVHALLAEKAHGEVRVIVDEQWRDYYIRRYGNLHEDIESLSWDDSRAITDIGDSVHDDRGVLGRYVGLLWFSHETLTLLKQHFGKHPRLEDLVIHQKTIRTAYMTDLLQYLIREGITVRAVPVSHGWLEFDSAEDYERAKSWLQESSLNPLWQRT